MQADSSRRSRVRPGTYIFFAVLFGAIVYGSHAPLITMPYFWDEVGHFIPAARDLFLDGSLIPHSTTPNVHPPAVMAWLALFWKVFGTSEAVTRCAMLTLASLALLGTFLLAIELCGQVPGVPALIAAGLLAASPLFYTQALLAQLDMPATLFTVLGLWLFLRERHGWAAAVCAVLAMVKETGVLLPLVLGLWLVFEGRLRRAAAYLVPLAVMAGWLLFLHARTGHWLGSWGFADYNLYGALRPGRILLAFARRLYFLFFANLHWVGAVGIYLGWRAGWLKDRRWKVAGVFACAHVVMISVLGGAVLERYALPVLPLFYIAAAAGFHAVSSKPRRLALGALLAGLIGGLFINPPFWPFPYENNLAMSDFTALQQMTASYLEHRAADSVIATAWPLSAELKRPELGYVSRRLTVLDLRDSSAEALAGIDKEAVDVLVRYSRDWDPPRSLFQHRAVRFLARRYLGYRPPVSGDEIEQTLGLHLIMAWERGGQWVEIYGKSSPIRSAGLRWDPVWTP